MRTELRPTRRPGADQERARDLWKMGAMMALFFLVVCAVGILRPIRNALALDGLGSTDFYKVYLVSAVVVFFVPLYNRLSDRIPPRRLIPAVALFFVLNLLVFRAVYAEGSTVFGLAFYGWYDLFAAALVTQFFMVTQMFFDARLARRAYPVVIAGGSIGASLGGAITGFFAERVGTPNLMLVAALLIVLFSMGIPLVWHDVPEERPRRRAPAAKLERGDLRAVFSHPQVRLIAAMVLLTILVKQLVDYEFNTLTKMVFEDRDSISAFQGKFNAATQWLPIVVLAGMQPALRRWGVGLAVLLLPVSMLLTTGALVIFFGLWAAVAAKTAETSLRYSAERAGREILYVPIPPDIKLKAKTYIDVAVEKGVGKVLSAGLIFVLLLVMDYRWIPLVALGLALGWVGMGLLARREYVNALSAAIQGRFASLDGVFASLADASSRPVLERALAGDEKQVLFALDLIDKAPPKRLATLVPAVRALAEHRSAEVRARALDLLARYPEEAEREAILACLTDGYPRVREAAVRAAFATAGQGTAVLVRELLGSEHAAVRAAALACITRGELGTEAADEARAWYASRAPDTPDTASVDERVEAATAAAALDADGAVERILTFADDPDVRVRNAALRSAGRLRDARLHRFLLEGLARPDTREAARQALAEHGADVLPVLAERLLDPATDAVVRRSIPSVLARIPGPETVAILIRCALAAETEQVLDYRVLKALSKIRAREPGLAFDPELVTAVLEREVAAARRYASCHAALTVEGRDGTGTGALLAGALREAWAERREGAFRTLGLLHPPGDVHRCYRAVIRDERIPRADALEWLETTLGHRLFMRLDPVLAVAPPATPNGSRAEALRSLRDDEDAWIAQCAARAAANDGDATSNGSRDMDPVEKVLLLQGVDVLHGSRSAHLALIASIADEVEVEPGAVLMRGGELAEALYVVVEGTVTLRGAGTEMEAGAGESFGAWSLIDEAAGVVDAVAATHARLLRIGREEFYDLLGDYPELAIGLLQGLARRMRALVA